VYECTGFAMVLLMIVLVIKLMPYAVAVFTRIAKAISVLVLAVVHGAKGFYTRLATALTTPREVHTQTTIEASLDLMFHIVTNHCTDLSFKRSLRHQEISQNLQRFQYKAMVVMHHVCY
jgi:hypothetical protein